MPLVALNVTREGSVVFPDGGLSFVPPPPRLAISDTVVTEDRKRLTQIRWREIIQQVFFFFSFSQCSIAAE